MDEIEPFYNIDHAPKSKRTPESGVLHPGENSDALFLPYWPNS